MLDDGDPCICPQRITYSHIICSWFQNAVLPLDRELYAELMKPQNTRICAVCGKPFLPNGNKAKYCLGCKREVRRRKQAGYQQKYAQKKRGNLLSK